MKHLDNLEVVIDYANGVLWGYVLLFLLCGLGIYFTIRLNFIQVRQFRTGLYALLQGVSSKSDRADKHGMSSFQAVTTAISGQVGTGNLAGPATAIMLGGPGAIFWMWVSSFLGMSTIYVESVLAQKFKTHDNYGHIVGGPAYYIEQGLKKRWLAIIFAISCILALGFAGIMVQSNSIALAFNSALNIPTWLTGILIAILVGSVIIGGIRSIAAFSEKIVPIMAVCYLLGACAILLFNYAYILSALKMIFVAAFNPESVIGGGTGIAIQHAMRFGIARGLFANEAGMGSTPHANAVAKVDHPEQQGFIAMMGVFVVCIIVTITALVIITSGLRAWQDAGKVTHSFLDVFKNYEGITITQQAYYYIFGQFGILFISVSLFFFAFTTIISWYYYAETNVRYLFGHKIVLRTYQLLFLVNLFLATIYQSKFAWNMADFFNAIMVLPNLVALFILSPIVISTIKH